MDTIIPRGKTRPKLTHSLSFSNATTPYRDSVGFPIKVSPRSKNNHKGIIAKENEAKKISTRLYVSVVINTFLKKLRHAKIAPIIKPTKWK